MNENTTSPLARLQGAALIAAPILLATSTIAYGGDGGMGSSQIGGAVQIYAMAAFPLGLLGLTRRLEGVTPRLAAWLSLLAILGATGGVAYGLDAVHGAVHPEAPLEALPVGPVVLQLPGLCFPLSLIGIGLSLARSRVAASWSGYALALGGLLFPISRIPAIVPLALAADGFILAALVPLGVAMLRGRPAAEAQRRPAIA